MAGGPRPDSSTYLLMFLVNVYSGTQQNKFVKPLLAVPESDVVCGPVYILRLWHEGIDLIAAHVFTFLI